MKFFTVLFLFGFSSILIGQSYTSYFTGNTIDIVSAPQGGICMMGGASEHDEAMKWFLQRCSGGDVLVLRASGSNGYNNYLYNQLGVDVNSVETIVCNSASASYESYVMQKIQQAEGIWFAGGDQWDYVSYWRNTPVDSLINLAIADRNIVIGGTSAGMAILGGFYFTAKNGTVTSSAALSNPYTSRVTVDSASFIHAPFLEDVITDTHYDNPDRKGRHVTFLARILKDYGIKAKGIACDEYTAVCIGPDGIAIVYGDYPSNDDNAYFIQTNCELDSVTPEQCTSGQPLIWDLNESALKVYAVKGTFQGSNTFDLNTWTNGTGGEWQNWYVENGTFHSEETDRIHCQTSALQPDEASLDLFTIFPMPFHSGDLTIIYPTLKPNSISIFDLHGSLKSYKSNLPPDQMSITDLHLCQGVYFVSLQEGNYILTKKLIVY